MRTINKIKAKLANGKVVIYQLGKYYDKSCLINIQDIGGSKFSLDFDMSNNIVVCGEILEYVEDKSEKLINGGGFK